MSSIKEIARIAQVSPATVSRVLNDREGVSAEKRRLIKSIIRELNYSPDHNARSLRQGRTETLGIMVTDIINQFHSTMVKGFQKRAHGLGYKVIICNTDGQPSSELEYLELLEGRHIDGMAITPRNTSTGDDVNSEIIRLADSGKAFVSIGRRLSHPLIDVVTSDTRMGMKEAVTHLLDFGYQRIAFVGGDPKRGINVNRYQGYKDALTTRNCRLDDRLVYTSRDFTLEDGYEAVEEILGSSVVPDAVVCVNDMLALGVLMALKARHIEVPDEVSVIGFDDIPLARLVTPRLTTVSQATELMGAEACELLVERLNAEDIAEARHRIYPTRIVVRETTPVVRQN